MTNLRLSLLSILLGYLSVAQSADNKFDTTMQVKLTQVNGTELQVEARQANLARLLDEIALKTGIKIHYFALPVNTPVTATCVGANAKQVLQCLLGANVDIAFRYSSNKTPVNDQQPNPEEIWILGSSLVGLQNISTQKSGHSLPGSTLQSASPSTGVNAGVENLEAIDQLLGQANAKNPEERAQAIARLAGKNSAKVTVALQKALVDKNANVRAQAINALAHREGEAATSGQLQHALRDSDVSVRLMAIDNIEQDKALLQQALQDQDESVRQMAEMKLDSLSKQ